MVLDTIVAIATAPGRGAVGIVRISGPKTQYITQVILGILPKPRFAAYLPFFDENKKIIDKGIAIYFENPQSLTGEDILELQGHGGPVVLDYLLNKIIQLGARMAKPGEFSERAFLNGKIDLVQAEAVADLINANSIQAAHSAMRSMQGEFSEIINYLVSLLIELRIYIEAAIDFPEEEIDFFKDGVIQEKLNNILIQIEKSFHSAKQGVLLRDGITVVIAGSPNAGKSSLLNKLIGSNVAITSSIPGTTRDVLREFISIDGLPVHLIDTAGLRESNDLIEQEGIRRAYKELEKADRILLIFDINSGDNININSKKDIEKICKKLINNENILFKNKVIIIINKIDLIDKKPCLEKIDNYYLIYVSARTGEGLSILREHIKSVFSYDLAQEGVFIARRRHLDILQRSQDYLQQACKQITLAQPCTELLAEELRLAQNTLSEITGEFRSDDLLGEIFSSFCIGK